MKLLDFILIVFLLFLGQNIIGQTENALDKRKEDALRLFKEKKYIEAGQKYSQVIDQIAENTFAEKTRYMASVSWALAENKEQAFKYLYQLVELDYYTDFKEMSSDARFKFLYNDARWEEIKVQVKENVHKIKELIPFYEMGGTHRHIDDEMFAREHIVLDGKQACMIPFVEKKGIGFVDKDKRHRRLIQPVYSQVLGVYKEGAIVLDSLKKYGLIQPDATFLIPANYHQLLKEGTLYHAKGIADDSRSVKGLPIKEIDGQRVRSICLLNDYYDLKGNLLFSEKSHDYETFIGKDQLAWFRYGKRYRIRNKSGKLLKEFEYEGEHNLFIGISDDLLIYSVIDEEKAIAYYVAKTLEGKVVFKVYTKYYLPEGLVLGPYGRIRGVYQLSENLYGLRPITDYEMHYNFCDSLGNEREATGDLYTMSMLPIDLDYFSKEQFIVSSYRGKGTVVINRKGDTIIPQPIVMGDTTILSKYGSIIRTPNQNFLCQKERRGGDYYDINGKLIKMESAQLQFKTKRIPWSEEKLQAFEAKKHDYKKENSYYSLSQLYKVNVAKNPKSDLSPMIGLVRMSKDISEKIKKKDPDLGTYILYTNSKGKTVLELPSDIKFAGYFSEGLAPALNEAGNLGFINRQGEWVISPKYDFSWEYRGYSAFYCPAFKGGYAFLQGYGYIDKNGKELFSDGK
jgi:hypothetical protein